MPAQTDGVTPILDREAALERAREVDLDVLVIGGGITGVGVALDAAVRGFRVALVERDDLASGTSSKSSKLVHGGVRYLANGDVAMVAEGVRERDRLRRLAPHLVRPLGFVIPVDGLGDDLQLRAGLALYDGIALGRNVRGHRRLSTEDIRTVAPGLVQGAARGGYRYYDCQTDDARLTLQVAQIARRFGALVIPHAEVTGLLGDGGTVTGATVRDGLTGETSEISARWTVSASGVWADRLRGLAPDPFDPSITPAKGVHLAFCREDVQVEQALVIPSGAGDGRRNFVIPWGEQVYIGTTDDAWDGDVDRPDLEDADAHYLLRSLNAAFGLTLTLDDAIGAWAGARPLVTGGASASKDLSRKHVIVHDPVGFITVTGGKLTTYRQMAEEVVDTLAELEGTGRRECSTHRLPLGATGTAEQGLARTEQVVAALGLDPTLAGGVFHRHGDRAAEVLAFCLDHEGVEPLVEGLPYLRGEVRWAAREELARTLDDVLQRRLRVSLRHAAAGGDAIAFAAGVLADELGWDDAERERQIDDYLARVAHERGPVPLDTSWREMADATV